MMDRFIENIAVVTGASSGIGEAICKELVKHGLSVVGLARRVKKLQALKDLLTADGKTYPGTFSFIQCNLTKEDEIRDAFQQIRERFGAVQVLVNNAGVLFKTSLHAAKAEHYDTVFNTNVKTLLLCSQEAIQSMNDNSVVGHIVNINSVAGLGIRELSVRHGIGIYAASKHAAKVFSEVLRREILLQKKHIKITDIHPGMVATDMTTDTIKTQGLNEYEYLSVHDIATACIYILETPPNVLISQMTIKPIHESS